MKKFDRSICDEIIEWFLSSNYAKDMDNCLNGIDENSRNPYHQERSILDHALMVSSEAIRHWRDRDEFYILFLAGLVHDIGKVKARSVEKRRKDSDELMCIFRNHENIGFAYAADVLLNFLNTSIARKIDYSWNEFKQTLLLVPYHDIYKYTHEEAEEMYRKYTKLIAMFSVCDTRGRLMDEPRNIDEHIKYISIDSNISENKINKYKSNYIDFLIGFPASGKSTYSEIHKNNYNYKYIISRDSIIENLNYYLSNRNEEFIFSKYKLNTSVLNHLSHIGKKYTDYTSRFNALTSANLQQWIDHIFMYRYHMAIMNNDGNILIDKTNLNKKKRNQLLNVFTSSPYGKVKDIGYNLNLFNKRAIIMAEGYRSIIERNEKRKSKVTKEIIDKFIMTSNIPNFEEFDDLIVTKIVSLVYCKYFIDDARIKSVIQSIINKSSYNSLNNTLVDLDYLLSSFIEHGFTCKMVNEFINIYENNKECALIYINF